MAWGRTVDSAKTSLRVVIVRIIQVEREKLNSDARKGKDVDERKSSYLVESMAALWNDMGLFSGQSEAEAEGLEANGALVLVVHGIVGGNDG